MNAAAAAAADFKTSFSPQFNGLMQPFVAADETALYAPGYAPTYNSWAGKVPSPLAGSAKSFPWGVNMSPLTAGFNHAPVSQMVMNTNSTIGMSSVATMSNSVALQAAATGPATHNYTNITSTFSPSNPYAPYRSEQCGPPPPPPPPVVSSVTATSTSGSSNSSVGLRFNSVTKTSSSSSSTSSNGSSGSLLSGSPRSSSTLTACQFAAADRSPVWRNISKLNPHQSDSINRYSFL